MKRLRVRIAACVIVLVAAVAAANGGNGFVSASPEARVVLVTGMTPGSDTIRFANSSMVPFTVAMFARDSSCATFDPMGVVSVSPPTLTITPMNPTFEVVGCAGQKGSQTGMQRCLFHGLDASNNDIVDFMGVCEYAGSGGLAPNPMALNFGTVAVGQVLAMTIQLTDTVAAQVDGLSFQIDDIDGNFVVGAPCGMDNFFCDATIPQIGQGSAAMITVECTPQTTGPHSALLYIDSNNLLFTGVGPMQTPIMLSCNGGMAGGPVLAISPSPVMLSAQAGAGSAGTTVSLTNTGTGSITIESVMITDVDPGAAADWMFATTPPCTLLPCAVPVSLAVTFTPTAIGSRHARMTITYNDGTSTKTAQDDLFGDGQGATLLYTGGAPIDFGVVPVGMTASVTFQLSNNGNEDTTATLSIDQGPFTVMPTPQVVSPGPPITFTVSCTPTMAVLATGHLSFAGSPLFGSPPATVDLRCMGTTSALFAVPSTLTFGEVRTGTPAVTKMVTLESAATMGQQLTLTGPPTLDMPNGDLSITMVSGSVTPVTFGVTVTPTADADLGDRVDAMDTIGDSIQIPITGHVVTASYVAPAMLDLGTFCVNQPTTASTVALSSTGTATIGLDAPVLLAGASSPFQLVDVTPPMYPTMLAPGASARLSVTPNRQPTMGQQNDAIRWTTDVAGSLTSDTQLVATFIASGAAIAPTDLEFGSVPAHTGMATQSVKIQNCNATQIMLAAPKIAPTNSPFAVVGMLPQMLGPGESTTFAVAFQPTTVDHFVATMTIDATDATSNTMMLQVTLVGDATGGGSGDGGSSTTPTTPTSLYACSCGSTGGVGGLLVALAIASVLARRRRAT